MRVTVIIGSVLSVVVAWLAYISLRQLHNADMGYSVKKPFDRRLDLYSEQAFYYSYMQDFVDAPDLAAGLQGMTHDTRVEYPDTINALSRFNIVPELAVGALYRAFRSLGYPVAEDPLDWFVSAVLLLGGLQWGSYFATATHLGKSPLSGICALLFVIVHNSLATRVTTSPTLRENLSLPFLWLQIGSVQSYLDAPSRSRSIAIVVATVLFMISWQFTQFLMLLQLTGLFATYILGYIPCKIFSGLMKTLLLAAVVVGALTIGNGMLVTSMWLLLLVGIICATTALKGDTLLQRILQGAAASSIMVALKTASTFVVIDDGHVFKIFRAKLFNYRDFMTELFLCGPTYRGMGPREYSNLAELFMLQLTALVILLVALTVCFDLFEIKPEANQTKAKPGKRNKKKKGQQQLKGDSTSNHLRSDMGPVVFNTIQCVLFTLLGMGIRRLSIVLVPACGLMMAVLASHERIGQIAQKIAGIKPGTIFKGVWVAVAIALCAMVAASPGVVNFIEDVKYAGPQGRTDAATGKLMKFLGANTHESDIIAADPVLSSMIKLTTRRRIVIHPHAENLNIRKRHHEFFQVYNRLPEEEVYSILKQWSPKYLVLADGPCNLRCEEGQTMAEMSNLPDAFGTPGNGQDNLPQFCKIARQQPNKLKKFKEIYNDGPFSILEIL